MSHRCYLIISLVLLLTHAATAQSQEASTAKLAQTVTIYRDDFGVPHIFGKTDASIVFGLMYAQCEDNFWQLETDLIRALGRQAELEGEKALANDLAFRAFEIEALAKAEYQRLPAQVKTWCDAFAAGLNYYVAQHANAPRLLTRFEPWHILAVNLAGRIAGLGRSGLQPDELRFGARLTADAAPSNQPALDLTTFNSWFAAMDDEPLEGSNMWVAAPSKSASGRALLFINPHVGFFDGGQRYEAHLHSDEGLNVYGFAILGTPYIRSGFNQYLGWSHTNNYADTVDAYLETFDDPTNPLAYRYGAGYRTAIEWTDEVKVKTDGGMETRRYQFRKTHHGPIIGARDGKAVAVRVAKLAEGGELEQRVAMNRARNFNEFKAALARLSLTGSNTIYADRQGNIFYVHGNAMPRRPAQFDWTKPVDGRDPTTEWQGYHSFAELPQLRNPRAGFLQNCNSTPFLMTSEGNPRREDFPAYVAPEPDTPRARSSRRILTSRKKFTFDEWTKAATDTTVHEAARGVETLAMQWEQLKREDEARAEEIKPVLLELKAWDQIARIDSTATTLYLRWHERISNDRENTPFKDLAALEKVVADLEKSFGTWRIAWGEINRLQRVHTSGNEAFSDAKPSFPVAGGPGTAGIVFTYNTRAEPGQQRRYGTSGNTFVAVVEFNKQPRARSIVTFGQSADPQSPHYLDQAALYAQGKFKPVLFSLAEIKKHQARAYQPGAR
jgi:acyl-homoserine-lactone acylase